MKEAPRKLRLGMVGGGRGAFIGLVHRIAARLDGRYELVAGALSSDPDRARASGCEIGLEDERSYADYRAIAEADCGCDAVMRGAASLAVSRDFSPRPLVAGDEVGGEDVFLRRLEKESAA